MACIKPSGNTEMLPAIVKALDFVLFRMTDRSGVHHVAKVLVHMFLHIAHIHLVGCLSPLEIEFHLRGALINACW